MFANPTMTDGRGMRLSTILILYVAQGLPIGLLEFAVTGWMAAKGATVGEIGYVIGMAVAPWSLKFINGALMDRYAYLPMGRRRAWILAAQLVMVISLLLAALVDPGPRDAAIIGGIAFAVNMATVFQDVGADALAVDIAEEKEHGIVSGLMAGGQALGMAISAAISGLIIYHYGTGAAYTTCAILVTCTSLYLVWVRERAGERRLPWSKGEAHAISLAVQAHSWIGLLSHAFRQLFRKDSLIWVAPLFLRGMGYGTMGVAAPFIAANYGGWNEAQIGAANGTGQFIAAIAAMTLGSFLCVKLGSKSAQVLTLGLFAVAAALLALTEPFWSSATVIWAVILGWPILYYLTGVPMQAITLAFSDPETGATQFSIYMACINQGTSFAGFTFALVSGVGGIELAVGFLAFVFTLALTITLLVHVPSRQAEVPHDPRYSQTA